MDPFPFGTLLFDLARDPGQENPIEDVELESRLIAVMVQLMEENEAPAEQYVRLGLDQGGAG